MSERALLDRVRHRLNSACQPSREGRAAVAWLMIDTRLLLHDCLAISFSRGLQKASFDLGLEGKSPTADTRNKSHDCCSDAKRLLLYKSHFRALHL